MLQKILLRSWKGKEDEKFLSNQEKILVNHISGKLLPYRIYNKLYKLSKKTNNVIRKWTK